MFGNQTEQRKPIRSYEATPNVTLSKMTPKWHQNLRIIIFDETEKAKSSFVWVDLLIR
jgi:hypothetical protein